jgi:hypothetical protein
MPNLKMYYNIYMWLLFFLKIRLCLYPSFTPDYFKHILLETLHITSYGTSMRDR